MHVVYLANYLGLNCPKQALNRMGRAGNKHTAN